MEGIVTIQGLSMDQFMEVVRSVIKEEVNTTSPQQIEIIDRPELLKRLGITEPTAITWGKKGIIPELRIGSVVRYNWAKVVEALESKRG